MSKGNRKFTPKTFESSKTNGDYSANIYNSMIESPAFNDLTKNQRLLYMYLKLQYYNSKNHPVKEDKTCFYFNAHMYREKFKLYSNDKQFYNDRDALISHGFIRVKENGKNTRTKSVYQFSSNWRLYNTVYFKIPACDMSSSLLNKNKHTNNSDNMK